MLNRTQRGTLLSIVAASVAAATPLRGESPAPLPTPRQLWERVQRDMAPFGYSILRDEVVVSDTDPSLKLRRLEVSFRSQTVGVFRRKMDHKALVYMPADPARNQGPDRRGKVVIVGYRYGNDYMIGSYAEPIAARTGYPTMILAVPGEYDGHDGESCWIYFLESLTRQTQDPADHNYFRLAIPYVRALDVFAGILGEKQIQAVIGGHSKRATAAFTAAAMDPERIKGVVYMGNESVWDEKDTSNPMRAVWPIHASPHVTAKVLYVGATNEGGYQMFNINRIVGAMRQPWSVEYIPNYRHDSDSEIQYLSWPMWVSHVFDGRPLTRIEEPKHEEDAEGTRFSARIVSPNKLLQVRAWYVYSDDEYWRDLVWYPEQMRPNGDRHEAYVEGKLPDAWLVEVRDTANGFPAYLSTLPIDITHKPTKRRSGGGMSRNWSLKLEKKP